MDIEVNGPIGREILSELDARIERSNAQRSTGATIRDELLRGGWVAGNGKRWYPAWCGKRGPKYPLEAQVSEDGLRVVLVDGEQVVQTFGTVAQLDYWCSLHGISSDEIGPYNGPWD